MVLYLDNRSQLVPPLFDYQHSLKHLLFSSAEERKSNWFLNDKLRKLLSLDQKSKLIYFVQSTSENIRSGDDNRSSFIPVCVVMKEPINLYFNYIHRYSRKTRNGALSMSNIPYFPILDHYS